MAQTARNLPANYPQPIAAQILKSEAQRQLSMVRQEIVTDLLSVLADVREPALRGRLVRLMESNLKSGIATAQRSQDLWPEMEEARHVLLADGERKPAIAKRFLKVFEQLDRVQRRSLELLEDSFGHARVILDRLQPAEPPSPVQTPPLTESKPR